MKQEIKDNLNLMINQPEIMDQLMQILELPDNQFKEVYPKLKESLVDVFKSPQTQREIINQLKSIPNLDTDAERESGLAFIEEIKNDDTLSSEKKDVLVSLFEATVQATCDLIEVPREKIEVKIMKCHPDAVIPTYAHPTDAGADISAVEDTIINSHETVIVKTGLKLAIPTGYECQVRPRSGLSCKTTLRIANAPGTIDSDYRGELGIIMTNIGNKFVKIEKGQKIAQLLIAPTPMMKFVETDTLDETSRGSGGFGSTDKS